MRGSSLIGHAGRSLLATLLVLLVFSPALHAQNNGGVGGGGGVAGGKAKGIDPPPGGEDPPPPPLEQPPRPPDPTPGNNIFRPPQPLAPGPGAINPPGPDAAPNLPTAPPGLVAPQPPGIGCPPPGAPPVLPAEADHLRGWRGWWYRHRAHYFSMIEDEMRGGQRANTDAGEIYAGLIGGQRVWADPERIRAEMGTLQPTLEPWLVSHRTELESVSLIAFARLDLPVDQVVWNRALRGNAFQREAAFRALGLRADAEALNVLRLALDGDAAEQRKVLGRELSEGDRVAAAHGLGLVALRAESSASRSTAFDALEQFLLHGFRSDARVQLACAEALRVAAQRKPTARESIELLERCEKLMPLLSEERRPSAMRAALFVAVARLLPDFIPASPARAELSALCCAIVQERSADPVVQYGAVQAFGWVVRPTEGDADAGLRWLAEVTMEHRQSEIRPAAVIALARSIGQLGWQHTAVETVAVPLLIELLDGKEVELRPWAALALGVAAVEARSRGPIASPATVLEALLDGHADSRSAEMRAALALGLGLLGEPEGLPAIRAEAIKRSGRAPYAEAVHALGMRGSDEDADNLLATLDARRMDPLQLEASGDALATLGRSDARLALFEQLKEGSALIRLAAARALGLYPNADSLAAYRAVLEDPHAGVPVHAAVIRSMSRWGDLQPGRLRRACVTSWNPLLVSALDAGGRER